MIGIVTVNNGTQRMTCRLALSLLCRRQLPLCPVRLQTVRFRPRWQTTVAKAAGSFEASQNTCSRPKFRGVLSGTHSFDGRPCRPCLCTRSNAQVRPVCTKLANHDSKTSCQTVFTNSTSHAIFIPAWHRCQCERPATGIAAHRKLSVQDPARHGAQGICAAVQPS